MDLLLDKSSFFAWTNLFHVPTKGDGVISANTTTLTNGKDALNVGFTQREHMLLKYTSVSLKQCQQFAQWYNGPDSQALDVDFEAAARRKVYPLDPNVPGNLGMARRYKIQLRILSNLALRTMRNHITHSSFKSFLAHKSKFSFLDEVTQA